MPRNFILVGQKPQVLGTSLTWVMNNVSVNDVR